MSPKGAQKRKVSIFVLKLNNNLR